MKKRFGLLGQKLSHSYSPEIHGLFGNPDYELIELEPNQLENFFEQGDFFGLNVTIPYKRDVMRFCARLSKEALAIGSVNTIVKTPGGFVGYNTDAYGFRFLAARAGIDFAGKKTVIFGSGGASRTVRAVATACGASEVVVISRTGADHYENLSKHYDAQILINATPLGTHPNVSGMAADPARFSCCEGAIDLVYHPHRTEFLMRAEARGIRTGDGLPMLVAQAKQAEELFFQRTIPEEENERVLSQIRKSTDNIVLIGMPGCGKSTIGRALAELTGRALLDIDERIEKKAGKEIPQLFYERGEEGFRELEREETAFAGAQSGKIITTGGGVVKDDSNYASLHRNGRIYFLKRALSKLERSGRPLSEQEDLEAMYRLRLPQYERFCDAVTENNASPREAAEEIWRDFCENSSR